MSNLRSRLAALRKTNEGGATLMEAIVAISIMAIVMVMVTNIEITTLNAQVALVTKMDVSTNARLISSNLEFRTDPTPITFNISSEGCEGEPVLMAEFPISANSNTCLTVTGDSHHYFVTGIAHDTNKEVRFDFDSHPIYLSPTPEVVPPVETSPNEVGVPTVALVNAENGTVTETVTFVDGTVSETVVQPDGSYMTTETSSFGFVKTLKGKGFVYGQAKKMK